MEDNDNKDEETLDVVFKKFQLLPPAPDLCQKCATKHDSHEPHNQESMYWHTWFENEYGRVPTWEDAMAHCSDEIKEFWRFELSRELDKPAR